MKKAFVHFTQKTIDAEIGELTAGSIKAFWSDGKFNMHDMLYHLLTITGPARVWISTFSISEAAVRTFQIAVEEGLITEFNCLFDYTIKTNKLQLLFFASHIASRICLVPNHSKLILIQNQRWNLGVVGSANMTPNPRKEAGVIFEDQGLFDYYLKHLVSAMDSGINVDFHE